MNIRFGSIPLWNCEWMQQKEWREISAHLILIPVTQQSSESGYNDKETVCRSVEGKTRSRSKMLPWTLDKIEIIKSRLKIPSRTSLHKKCLELLEKSGRSDISSSLLDTNSWTNEG
jgi:hypothetical protein